MAELEFRTWGEPDDNLYAGGSYEEAYTAMREAADRAIAKYGAGEARAGVLHPYGLSIQVVDGDEDVTQDWLINHPDQPLELA